MIQLFARYFSVGVINTLLHWVVFAALVYLASTTQATANLIAFIVAVTFSFFANAKFTFKKKATSGRYVAFVGFMGVLSYLTGFIADKVNAAPIITLVAFSAISLVLGFLYSKLFVFKGME
ncbi:GtrA family protein [Morganella morganii subsp. morganii]|uniref:GtrA family protein n=2 Tax=Morganella morganii TaxID=582 RepID=UPI000C7A7099|nr:GtrA family protein [Morganella morganii]ELA8474761.1 GtrA family protein [Morganella morganii]MBT0448063.1 GtrA family protein [Morganella morganii subsp. morganii]MBT0449596.1 GtrA family protein [Morganella morganii subsp. morganii]MDF5911817.1 GtrA family protein [Morganella morganii]MDI9764518.1 GtrA family protein [Morganella morganii]